MALALTIAYGCDSTPAGFIYLRSVSGGSGTYNYVLTREPGTVIEASQVTATQLAQSAPDGLAFDSQFDGTYKLAVTDAADPNNSGEETIFLSCGYSGGGGTASLAITGLTPQSPIAPATTGSVSATATGGTPPYAAAIDGGAPSALTGSAIYYQGLAPGAHRIVLTDSADAVASASFVLASAGILGCTTARALNYDAGATQDDTPTLCVFVDVPISLSGLVAAHLPIPVVVRASPTIDGLASIVVLYLETAATPAGPWQEFGRLRQVCDATASAFFDLSEAAKSLLRIGVPVESGTDTSLSALLRARYEVLDPATLQPAYAGAVGSCRALNAVVQSSSGATLTTQPVYEDIPATGVVWRSTATYAGGVVSAPVLFSHNSCVARQLVWLNAAGAWDTGFFFGRHVHGTDQADPIQFRDLAGADRYAKRGTVRPTLQVYSDKVDWPTFRLLRGVRNSIQVWERLAPGKYTPVLVSTESYTEYQEVTDKTYQVNFIVSYPAQLIQTQ
jgi:hypothetical protein